MLSVVLVEPVIQEITFKEQISVFVVVNAGALLQTLENVALVFEISGWVVGLDLGLVNFIV